MKFEFGEKLIDSVSCDMVIGFCYQGKEQFVFTDCLKNLDKKLDGVLSKDLLADEFCGKGGETYVFHTHRKIVAPKVLVIGLGKKSELTKASFRLAVSKGLKYVNGKVNSLACCCSETLGDIDEAGVARIIADVSQLTTYRFQEYKKREQGDRALDLLHFVVRKSKRKKVTSAVSESQTVYRGVCVARDLVNEQSAVVDPKYFSKLAKDIARGNSQIECSVFGPREIKKMKMDAFLGVARGSLDSQPPQFIVLRYVPNGTRAGKKKKKIALVGKGITFDTGGVSIKPANYMTDMKCDMAGAAAVLGVFSVISKLDVSCEVMGIIAATPNVVSAQSYLPGDVLKASNGKTIEVLNTDAEGRITLADSLSYAVKNGATEIVNLATLTGACVVALGQDYAGLFSNDDNLAASLEKSAEESYELVWRLPLPETYREHIKSSVADIANIGSTPYGGAIHAGLFLQEFVDDVPWVHLDIAGPAYQPKDHAFGPKGGTGYGVGLLLSYLMQKNT